VIYFVEQLKLRYVYIDDNIVSICLTFYSYHIVVGELFEEWYLK